MSVDETEQVAALAAAIQRYLADHPNAADNAEGVTRWWLKRQRYEVAFEEVCKALDYLVAQGLVTKTTTAGGQTIYTGWPPGREVDQ